MASSALDREDFRQRADQALLVLYATVGESLGWATASLLEQDTELAERVIADDRDIDERCRDLTGMVKDRLSEGPLPGEELEQLIALLQMVPELERSADLAEHIAQRGRQGLGGSISPRARGIIQSMCDAGIRMWHLSARAYAERSRDLSFELSELDDELDNLSANLVQEGAIVGTAPTVAAELALVARFYERLGDHAVNLARRSAEMVAPRRLSPLSALRRRRPADQDATARLKHRFPRLRLLPSDSEFFEMFAEGAALVRSAATELAKLMSSMSDGEDHYHEIRTLERRGDQLAIEVLRRLDATFVTPYDREDIHAMVEAIEDVLDDIYAVAATVHVVNLDSDLPEVNQQAEILDAMGVELQHLIGCLRSKEGARHRLERIEELEREGDALHRRIVGRLFSGAYEPLEVLKWKDITQALEDAINQVEDVSDVVEAILVKET